MAIERESRLFLLLADVIPVRFVPLFRVEPVVGQPIKIVGGRDHRERKSCSITWCHLSFSIIPLFVIVCEPGSVATEILQSSDGFWRNGRQNLLPPLDDEAGDFEGASGSLSTFGRTSLRRLAAMRNRLFEEKGVEGVGFTQL